MPTYSENNYYINGIEDIPEKYQNRVLNNSSTSSKRYEGSIIPGERKDTLFSFNQISEEFSDEGLLYFGHGTPVDSSTIDKILIEGLNVKNPEAIMGYDSHLRGLKSTSICLGLGEENLYAKESDILNNWPHKGATSIIIIGLPDNYVFKNGQTNFFADQYKQFYVGDDNEGYKLRPEFIKGVYDVTTQTFALNKNFYKNLPENMQKKIYDELDDNYIKAYAENVTLPPDIFNTEIPIDSSKLEDLYVNWYSAELKRVNNEQRRLEELMEMNEEETLDNSNWEFSWDDEEVVAENKHI